MVVPCSLVEAPHLVPHRGPALGVEPGGGLVQEEDVRIVDQGRRQVEASLHAARVRLDLAVDGRADVDEPHDLLHAYGPFGPSQPVQPALEVEKFPPGLAVVERGVLEGDADLEPDLLGLARHVEAGHDPVTACRAHERAQHADQGRLARSVRPQEAVDLTGGDLEVDPRHGPELAELAGDVLRGDGGGGHGRSRYRSARDGRDDEVRRPPTVARPMVAPWHRPATPISSTWPSIAVPTAWWW